MKLVEVLMLMGAHCVSPLEQTQMTTDATKVQCAVVIEKDTDNGTLTVNPREAVADPLVAAAVARFAAAPVNPFSRGGTRIVPARAPAGAPPVALKVVPATPAAVAPSTPPPEIEASVAAKAEAAREVAVLAPAKPQRPTGTPAPATKQPAKAKAPDAKSPDAKQKGKCKGAAMAKWYTAANGHRKYRCVRPEPAGYSTPDQLY